jgi:hypothetical protein
MKRVVDLVKELSRRGKIEYAVKERTATEVTERVSIRRKGGVEVEERRLWGLLCHGWRTLP